jgi:hypothetical protein
LTNSVARCVVVWEISMWKRNKLPSFINRWVAKNKCYINLMYNLFAWCAVEIM